MPFDTFRCPQNESECLVWFFDGIGKQLGAPADDWESVMESCGLEPGYGPGVIPSASMPNFAITQQYSGVPKGRIFLPTDRPDENNYYTRCIQIIADDPNRPGKLIWSWDWIAGHEYCPVQDAESENGGNADYLTRAQLDEILKDYFKVDDKIALESNNGKILCMEGGGPSEDNLEYYITSRSHIGAWETLKLKRGQ